MSVTTVPEGRFVNQCQFCPGLSFVWSQSFTRVHDF